MDKNRYSNPLVSVLIPSYNSEAYIGAAIESVVSQDYGNMQIIVADDGSTDNTRKIVDAYSGVQYYYKDHSGISATRNYCLEKACGDYIAWVDADDIWLPGKLTAQVQYMRAQPDCEIVFTRYENLLTDSKLLELPRVQHELGIQNTDAGYLPCSLMRADLFSRHGLFSEELVVGEDTEMLLRLAVRGVNMKHVIDGVYYHRRLHGGNITLKYDEQRPQYEWRRLFIQHLRAKNKLKDNTL